MNIHHPPQAPTAPQANIAKRFWRRHHRIGGAGAVLFTGLLLAACNGTDGTDGTNGTDGADDEFEEPAAAADALDNDILRGSYGLGYNVINNLKEQFGADIDAEAFVLGVREGLADAEIRVTEEQFMAGIHALGEAREATRRERAVENLARAEAFLAENAEREGVMTTESGLQYEVLTEGDGASPDESDTVSTHYEGSLISGEVFDSSIAQGEPVTFPVEGVIPGWVEALQMMQVGSRWRLYLPPWLAYGEAGAGSVIGPNEVLVFEVELLEIVDTSDQEEPPAADLGELLE